MFRRSLFLLFLVAFLGGCSTSGDPGQTTTQSPSQSQSQAGTSVPVSVVQGRGVADIPLQGAKVEAFTPAGQPISTVPAVAGVNGEFTLRGAFPESFRVVVTPAPPSRASAVPLSAEIAKYNGQWIGVDYVTNLVSRYMRAHPEITQAEAETRVRTYLAIPAPVDLGNGLDADRGLFSRTEFTRRATVAGGVEAYTQTLVARIDSGSPPSPITAESGTESPTSPSGKLATSIFKALATDALKAGAKDTFGWVSSMTGFHIGGPNLREISAELNQIEEQLALLSLQIRNLALTAEYQSDQAALEPAISNITGASGYVNSSALTFSTQPGVGDPNLTPAAWGPPPNLVSAIQSQQWNQQANLILDYMLGRNSAPNNMIYTYNQYVMSSLLADGPTAYGAYPLRTNATLTQLQWQADFYLKRVDEALMLLAENAHLLVPDVNGNFGANGLQIMNAKNLTLPILASVRQAWVQLPVVLQSDSVMVDTEYGITWDLAVYGPGTCPSTGTNLVMGPYGSTSTSSGARFVLPTEAQIKGLRTRCVAINPSNPTQALTTLGFQGIDPKWTNLEVWINTGEPGLCEQKYFNMYNGDIKKSADACDTHATGYYAMYCIAYPGTAEADNVTNPLLANGVPTALTVQIDPTHTQLKCIATSGTISSGGSFRVGAGSASVTPRTVTRTVGDDITGSVVWTVSNPTVCDVSNLDKQVDTQNGQLVTQPGLITWHTPQTVTFTATFGGQSATITVDPPNPFPTPQLKAVQVLPTNLLFSQLPPFAEYFYATGFYSDDTAADVNALITWTVTATDGSPVLPVGSAVFSSTIPNLLFIQAGIKTAYLSVTATLGSLQGSGQILVPVP